MLAVAVLVPESFRMSPMFGRRLGAVGKTRAAVSVGSLVRASFFLCSKRACFSFSLVPQKPFIRPAGMLCGVSFAGPLHSALKWASRVGGHVPGGLLSGG
jgi:hypothetical protein